MSENNVIQLRDKNNPLIQLNQELDAYLYELTVLFYKTNELQGKVQNALGVRK